MAREFHEAANIFPLDEEEIDSLADDIKAHGLEIPIELFEEKIVDGRRRYLACNMAGVEPRFVEVLPDDPVAYVLSLNLHRRHLTPSQRSMVAARARGLYDQQAKERQKESGGDRKTENGKNRKQSVQENLPEPKGQSRDAAGKAMGVSGKSVDFATKVLKQGTPELVKAVDEGRMAVSTAAIYASEPDDVQAAVVSDPKRNRKYKSVSNKLEDNTTEQNENEPIKSRGVGVRHANEAIDCLKRIPQNDGLRKRAFQMVSDWIKQNR